MKKAVSKRPSGKPPTLYKRIQSILESAQSNVARSVNTTQVIANWPIGREIVEEEQGGRHKADYGDQLIDALSARLQSKFGRGYSATNLKLFRQFFQMYPELLPQPIRHTACDELAFSHSESELVPSKFDSQIGHTACDQSWKPGWLNPNLSWSLYRNLVRVETPAARGFYEIEASQNRWTARELERQINSLLFERLAKSKDKKGVMRLATKGQEIASPLDIFKDPVVIEFVGLPESPKLVESDLEAALLNDLQAFLLELGKGFAFVSRQERITLDGDHFYIDLVFYHVILKCYVLIDLKVGKLTHADLGQLQLYVNYYDEERRTDGDNPTLGLILCTDKNDAVVKYTLGPQREKNIFASRYQLHLPTEDELRQEERRELRALTSTAAAAFKRDGSSARLRMDIAMCGRTVAVWSSSTPPPPTTCDESFSFSRMSRSRLMESSSGYTTKAGHSARRCPSSPAVRFTTSFTTEPISARSSSRAAFTKPWYVGKHELLVD